MKQFGPQEDTWAVLYDKKDYDFMQKVAKDSKLLDLFELNLKQRYNDHKDAKLNGIEFLQIEKAEDIPTFPGLAQCCKQILGISTTRFTFMCVGSDGSKSSPFQQLLVSEAASRLSMSISGSMTRSGQALRFVANFPASFQTITARESGVNTTSTPNTGILLNRNAFPIPIVHTSGVTAFTLATLITFSAVTTWG